MKTVTLMLLCATASAGCNDGPVEPSLVVGPRVLAVRQVGDDDRVVVEALAPYATEFLWSACPAPFLPGLEPTCPVPVQTLDGTNPLVLDASVAGSGLWLRLDARSAEESALPTVVRLRPDIPAAAESTVLAVDGTAGPFSTRIGQELLFVVEPPPADNDTVTWFTSGGRFTTWRTRGATTSALTAPETAGAVTVWVVLRTVSGSVSWAETSVEVSL